LLIDALNWLWILLTAYLTGYVLLRIAAKLFRSDLIIAKDSALAAGTVFLTVFAEICSLFTGVGEAATLLLALITVTGMVLLRKPLRQKADHFRKSIHTSAGMGHPESAFVFFLILILFVLFLSGSAMQPSSYDDYLYHAQALEWIERYGVVPGLGNLHFRFAYNSAFLCLQALFSWQWVTGQSLHTVNALYAFLLSAYCISSFSFLHQRRSIQTSDLLKFIALVYLFYDTSVLTGLDTDPLAMMTVIYIFIKWAELEERQENEGSYYALLSLLAVFACTLKLSCGPAVLLALYPICRFARKRQGWKTGFSLVSGSVILLPYLIRNVIISGYLLYPMNGIDLFSVDWKMPVYTLVEDRQGILIWGRSLNSLLSAGKSWAEVAAMPFLQWFPIWFRSISHIQQLLFIAAFIAFADFLIRMAGHLICRTRIRSMEFLLFVSLGCFAFWLFTAPLIRYGSLYMMIVAGCWFGVYHEKGSRILFCIWIVLLAVELSGLPAGSMLYPADYTVSEDLAEQTVSSGNTEKEHGSGTQSAAIYYPENGDRTDYRHFPSAPSSDLISGVEMRGDDFSSGFRSRDHQESQP
jgi:hypothetical protein